MEMYESRATNCSTAHGLALVVVVILLMTINWRNTTSHFGKVNFGIDVPPRPNLIYPPLRTRSVQPPPHGVPTSLPIEKPKISHSFGILKVNLEA